MAKRRLTPRRPSARTAPTRDRTPAPPSRPAPEPPRTLRLGIVAGVTAGKWIDRWKERMPHVALELVPLEFRTQDDALASDAVDLALIRLPLDNAELHLIRLYDEVAVVVASADSHLLAADELDAADLAGETLFVPRDNVLGSLEIDGTVAPRGPQIEQTADATVAMASGAGIVIVPQSLARLHHRKDADYRSLREGPVSSVALAWPRDRTTADIETFVGIVRGRTARSSR